MDPELLNKYNETVAEIHRLMVHSMQEISCKKVFKQLNLDLSWSFAIVHSRNGTPQFWKKRDPKGHSGGA